ncbi:cytochrome P450 monooxygenase-like protein [Pyrenochaeta sp. MPI-SDFR-AT-0127]|nr:cytochrome P450 monooxygenase-like protein [Pyrenochaeta sp. MPI-SDFR-AT-0127]
MVGLGLGPESYLSTPTAAIYAAGLVCSVAYVVFYRLFFHPLAHIPGPKLAALTFLYQTYHSFKNGSRFYKQVGLLHKKYGPIVRITPNEVSLSDPQNYETIYYVGSKYAKDPRFYDAFGMEYASFTSCPNELHRLRRGPLNKFFSRAMVLELQSIVQEKANKLCSLIAKNSKAGEMLDIHHGCRAVSIDIITEYMFNKCYDLLDARDLGTHFFELVRGIGPALWVFQQCPELSIMNRLPTWMLKTMSPPLAQILNLQEHAKQQILVVKADLDAGRVSKDARTTIFHELLTPNPEEGWVPPTPDQIKYEAYGILAAAADTTGNGLTTGVYEVIKNPKIYAKLTAELKAAFPDPNAKMELTVLERLPYLTGVVNESLRLSFGVISRLPRIVPEGGAKFEGYTIPAGFTVSMSSWVLHRNEDYFPHAQEFIPERWALTNEKQKMWKAFVPFGKGSRMCVGMPLAFCELYVTLGSIFRRFEHLKGNELSAYDLLYDDFFASHRPMDAVKFHIIEQDLKE